MNSNYLQTAERAFGFDDPSLAVGLNDIAFFSSELPFLNVIKQVGDSNRTDGAWKVQVPNEDGTVTEYDYSEAVHAGFLDSNGNVQNLPEGASATFFLFSGLPAEAKTGGTYIFSFEGEADLTLFGGVINTDLSEPGRLVVEIEDATAFGVGVNGTNPDNHIRELSLVREEHVEIVEAGAIFNPDFIELFADHGVLRFMDWMETNNSNQIDFADLATLDSAFYGIPANQTYESVFASELPELEAQLAQSGQTLNDLPRGAFTPIFVDPVTGEPFRDAQTNEILIEVPPEFLPDGIATGVPVEILVELANQVGADPWFNIPHQASDDYIRQFAEYVRDNLEPGLTARFEYSNEVWNGGFEQFSYANERGLELFGSDTPEFGEFPFAGYYGYKSAEVLSIINDVFAQTGQQDQVHGVLGTQAVNQGVTTQALLGVEAYIAANDPGASVDTYFDSLAVAGYYGPVITEGSAQVPGHLDLYLELVAESVDRFENPQNYSDNPPGGFHDQYQFFVQQVVQDLRDGSITKAYFAENRPDLDPSQYPFTSSLEDLRTAYGAQGEAARINGLELIQYEGGSHLLTDQIIAASASTDPGAALLLEFLAVVNDSPDIAQVNTEALILFREEEGATLANDFVGVAQRTTFGPFGSIEHLNDQSPVFDSFIEYNLNAATATQLGGTSIAQPFGSINEGRDRSAFLQGRTDAGTSADDLIIGSVEEDFLAGSTGNDTLVGGRGDDGINGGDGFDIAVFSGTAQDHNFSIQENGLRVIGADGDDFLVNIEAIGFENGDTILIDTLLAAPSPFISYFGGQEFNPLLAGVPGALTIVAFNNTFTSGAFSTTAGALNAPASAVDQTDIVYFAAPIDLTLEQRNFILGAGPENVLAQEAAFFISNVGTVLGTNFDDLFEGHFGDEIVNLGEGNDTIFGFGGNDTLIGGNGVDSIHGGTGNDLIEAGFGIDVIDGGDGIDVAVLTGLRFESTISAENGGVRIINSANNDFFQNIEFFRYADGQQITFDQLFEDLNPNLHYFSGLEYQAETENGQGVVISALAENTVTGDELGVVAGSTSAFSDEIYLVSNSIITFDLFQQIHDFGAANAAQFVDLITGVDAIQGTEFSDSFFGTGSDEIVNLGDGNDSIVSGAGNDEVRGGNGDDTIDAGDGNDTLYGGAGNDLINGGAGADIIFNALGDDIINGGAGFDLFVLSGQASDYSFSEVFNGIRVVRLGSVGVSDDNLLNEIENVIFDDGVVVTLQSLLENEPAADGRVTDLDQQAFSALGDGTSGVTISALDITSQTAFDLGVSDSGYTSTADTVFFVADKGNPDATLETINGGFSGAELVVDFFTNPGAVSGTAFADTFVGDIGDENVILGDGDDIFFSGGGDDSLVGGNGNDQIFAGDGNDELVAGAGDDLISAGAGDDVILAGSGADTIDGGAGLDTLSFFNSEGGVLLNLETDVHGGLAQGDSITGIEIIIGSNGNDTIFADENAVEIVGGAGDDFISGGSGGNTLSGGSGTDTIVGGLGDDVINGGSGNDLLILLGTVSEFEFESVANGFVISGAQGTDSVTGVEGVRFSDNVFINLTGLANVGDASATNKNGAAFHGISFTGAGVNIGVIEVGNETANDLGVPVTGFTSAADTVYFVADVNNTNATQEAINAGADIALQVVQLVTQVGSFIGTQFADTFTGSIGSENVSAGGGDDTLTGFAGNDTLAGGEGNDIIVGGAGDDVLLGGLGADNISGGAGNDTLSFADATSGVVFDLTDSSQNTGAAIGDVVSGVEFLTGSGGNDRLVVTSDFSQVDGAGGDDIIRAASFVNTVLNGGDGNDIIFGGGGDDQIDGGGGDDIISGGAGNDFLVGGFGSDTLSFDDVAGPVTLNFETGIFSGDAAGDTFVGFEIVLGSQSDDTIVLGGSILQANGNGGNDFLVGNTFNNVLVGGAGDDILDGGLGVNVLVGGDGEDRAILADTINDHSIEQDGDNFIITGINGVNTLIDVETVEFSDGFVTTLTDWLNNQGSSNDDNDNGGNAGNGGNGDGSGDDLTVIDNEGNVFVASSDQGVGVRVQAIATGSVTATQLGIPDDAYTDILDVVYSVANVDITAATSTFVNGGAPNANSVGLLITQVSGFFGTQFDDSFTGVEVDENISAGDGNDTLSGLGGNDLLNGGGGNDFLFGDTGDDVLAGGAGADVIFGGEGFDTLTFATSTSAVRVDFVNEINTGDAEGDFVVGVEALVGSDHNDLFILGDTIFTADGGIGNDTLTGANGNDILTGGEGADRLNGVLGDDVLTGGFGSDVLNGGSGDDHLLGGVGSDVLLGGSGNDSIEGNGGNDFLRGNSGFDTLRGGNGDDSLFGDFNADRLFGGAGDDFLDGGAGPDELNGGAGDDVLEGGDTGDDLLFGGSGNDTILGESEDDILRGNAGFDELDGGSGDDSLFGNFNADTLLGGDGDDFLDGGAGPDELNGGAGDDVLEGGDTGDDILFGGLGNDTISGGSEDDFLRGNAGSDQVLGGSGDDVLFGDADNDTVSGGDGEDVLIGGAGNDNLAGGLGDDIFIFDNDFGNDFLTDFDNVSEYEVIDLSGIGGIADFEDLQANNLTNNAFGSAVITIGDNTITLLNVDADDLAASDFIF